MKDREFRMTEENVEFLADWVDAGPVVDWLGHHDVRVAVNCRWQWREYELQHPHQVIVRGSWELLDWSVIGITVDGASVNDMELADGDAGFLQQVVNGCYRRGVRKELERRAPEGKP